VTEWPHYSYYLEYTIQVRLDLVLSFKRFDDRFLFPVLHDHVETQRIAPRRWGCLYLLEILSALASAISSDLFAYLLIELIADPRFLEPVCYVD
jgi:hypothetical protein